jgi:hypothetical protein
MKRWRVNGFMPDLSLLSWQRIHLHQLALLHSISTASTVMTAALTAKVSAVVQLHSEVL